jgi:hypothetical protein
MNEQSSGTQDAGRRRLERAVVLELLAEERADGISTAELQHALGAADGELDAAVGELAAAGVLEASGETVRASAATRRLDGLELIGI